MLLGGRKLFAACLLVWVCVSYSHLSNARHHTGFDLGLVVPNSTVCVCLYISIRLLCSSCFHHRCDDIFSPLSFFLFHLLHHSLCLFLPNAYFPLVLNFHACAQCSVSVDSLCPPFLMKINVNISRVHEWWIFYPTHFSVCVANTAQTAAEKRP